MNGTIVRTIAGHAGPLPALFVWLTSLYSASHDGSSNNWNTTTGALIHTYTGHTARINVIFLTHDTLYSASSDKSVRRHNMSDNVVEVVTLGAALTDLYVTDNHLYVCSEDDKA